MQRPFQNRDPRPPVRARKWFVIIFSLAAALSVAGLYAWNTGLTRDWILFAGLLVLLLTIFFLRSRLASWLLKEVGTRTVHSQAGVVRSALQAGLQQTEDLFETRSKSARLELKKMAVQASKELDLAANGLKRDIPRYSSLPASLSPAGGLVCSTCGQVLRSTSRFCDRCGTPLSRRCPACGGLVRSATARFCDECGTSLAE